MHSSDLSNSYQNVLPIADPFHHFGASRSRPVPALVFPVTLPDDTGPGYCETAPDRMRSDYWTQSTPLLAVLIWKLNPSNILSTRKPHHRKLLWTGSTDHSAMSRRSSFHYRVVRQLCGPPACGAAVWAAALWRHRDRAEFAEDAVKNHGTDMKEHQHQQKQHYCFRQRKYRGNCFRFN